MGLYTSSGAERFRLYDGGASNPTVQASGLQALSTPSLSGSQAAKPWHPNSPLFAFAALGAVTFLAMAVGTGGQAGASFHIGKLRAGVAGNAGVGK